MKKTKKVHRYLLGSTGTEPQHPMTFSPCLYKTFQVGLLVRWVGLIVCRLSPFEERRFHRSACRPRLKRHLLFWPALSTHRYWEEVRLTDAFYRQWPPVTFVCLCCHVLIKGCLWGDAAGKKNFNLLKSQVYTEVSCILQLYTADLWCEKCQ